MRAYMMKASQEVILAAGRAGNLAGASAPEHMAKWWNNGTRLAKTICKLRYPGN